MTPWLGPLAMMGGGALSGLLQGNPEQYPTITRLFMREQPELLKFMIGNFRQGQGEFGFGPLAKQAHGSLLGMLGQRNINPRSGVAGSLYANMLAQAMGQDVNARRQFGLNLAQARPATVSGQQFGKPFYY